MSQKETTCHALYEGTYSVGRDKKFNSIDRDEDSARGALKISLNPFLIKSPHKNILVDAGLGNFAEDGSTDTIKQNLVDQDAAPDQITDIFLSHLHFDHLGDLATPTNPGWELTFPKAKLWVNKKDWRDVIENDRIVDETKNEFIHFVNDEADVRLLDEQDQPYPEIHTKIIGGHSKFSQLLLFDFGEQKYMMAGDVLATRGEVNHKFAAKYDYDGKKSQSLREELTQKAYEEDYTILGYHDSHHPIFKLTAFNKDKGYTIETSD